LKKNNNYDSIESLGVKAYDFPSIIEENKQGVLRIYESDKLPFVIKRVFTVMNALSGSIRGQHAHKKCNQLLCCVSGEIDLTCDNGYKRITVNISSKSKAFWVPNGIWAEQVYKKNNSAIIVFCDEPYDENDYIRDYNKYLQWKEVIK
jgi:dTDP-4-dehydrorhamnose 3,5-epimerase-like enzyme